MSPRSITNAFLLMANRPLFLQNQLLKILACFFRTDLFPFYYVKLKKLKFCQHREFSLRLLILLFKKLCVDIVIWKRLKILHAKTFVRNIDLAAEVRFKVIIFEFSIEIKLIIQFLLLEIVWETFLCLLKTKILLSIKFF